MPLANPLRFPWRMTKIREGSNPFSRTDRGEPPAKSKFGRIAVKVIDHLGDELMKVFKVG